MDYYKSLDSLISAYKKFCEITRFQVIKDSKFVVIKNKKILKEGFHEIKDNDVFICYKKTNIKEKLKIEFIFNKNPKDLAKEGFVVNSNFFIKKLQKDIGRNTYNVYTISE
jgi:hypothetical protein